MLYQQSTEYLKNSLAKSSKLKEISSNLKINKEASARNELLYEYLEIVENFLISHVAENFDFFSKSFDNIRDMETEMGEIKEIIQETK